MKKLLANEIREKWLEFWKSKNHEVVPSKSLIPVNDPSILWINSGIATLKDYFSGNLKPKNPRITNSQKCIRTNDIENVGVTARHQTLFEMLGNFSIGDYFKEDAIKWAYEFLFDVLEFDKDKIYITYFNDDVDTYKIWLDLGIQKDHLIKGNRETNFWDLGEGPCGPDTEIFYDCGKKYDPKNIGIKLLEEDIENDRYREIWNIVFSQFNNDGENNYTELSQKNIDTGAGLERLASVMQDTPTNFETDLFMPIIHEIEKLSNSQTYDANNYFINEKKQAYINRQFRIIADHIRAVTLAIQDGAKPSSTRRGYIIRRLIRRSYRAGYFLGVQEETFLHKLVSVVSKVMPIYPIDIKRVQEVIKKEEMAFAKTIEQGQKLLFDSIKDKKTIDIKVAFKLYETYGFPIELTKELLEEKNIELDMSEFKKYQDKHAEVSKNNKVTKAMQKQIQIIKEINDKVSEFIGYDTLESHDSKILVQGVENNKIYLLLDKTPFYATSGGQVHDLGKINDSDVIDVFKDIYGNHWHVISQQVEGKVHAIVDKDIRARKARNHSGTHLLGYALRKVIGNEVIQLGSENDEKKLRFDFPFTHKPTDEEIKMIENKLKELINQKIKREYIIDTWENGLKMGALALENEEHDPNHISRIVKFDKSIEFCGGTHVENSCDLEKFKIVKIESKGSGIYRIEAITSYDTVDQYNKQEILTWSEKINAMIDKLKKISPNAKYDIPHDLNAIKDLYNQVNNDLKTAMKENQKINVDKDYETVDYQGMPAIVLLNEDVSKVKNLSISLREKYPNNLIIIGGANNQKMTLAVASKVFDSKSIFDKIANQYNGRGGGNKSFAMGSMNIIKLLN